MNNQHVKIQMDRKVKSCQAEDKASPTHKHQYKTSAEKT